jgi:hypothetical protein
MQVSLLAGDLEQSQVALNVSVYFSSFWKEAVVS